MFKKIILFSAMSFIPLTAMAGVSPVNINTITPTQKITMNKSGFVVVSFSNAVDKVLLPHPKGIKTLSVNKYSVFFKTKDKQFNAIISLKGVKKPIIATIVNNS